MPNITIDCSTNGAIYFWSNTTSVYFYRKQNFGVNENVSFVTIIENPSPQLHTKAHIRVDAILYFCCV